MNTFRLAKFAKLFCSVDNLGKWKRMELFWKIDMETRSTPTPIPTPFGSWYYCTAKRGRNAMVAIGQSRMRTKGRKGIRVPN